MTDRTTIPPEGDALAAELAFGFLEGREADEAHARRLTDPAFDAAVADWEKVADQWLVDLPTQEAPDNVWPRIDAALFGGSSPEDHSSDTSPPELTPVYAAANDDHATVPSAWRWGAIAASVIALLFAGLWLGQRQELADNADRIASLSQEQTPEARQYRVAQVNSSEDGNLMSALYDDSEGEITVRVATVAQDELVPELWVIGPDGQPQSLGQSRDNGTLVIKLSPEMRADIQAGSAIAISLEPQSDTPSETPTAENILGAAELIPVT
ncbi:MAG: anti-sigma factor [Pontixanthobacter sp.]